MGSGLVGAPLSLKALSRLSYRDARYLETLYDSPPLSIAPHARSSDSLFGDSDDKGDLNPISNSQLVDDERDGRSSHLPALNPRALTVSSAYLHGPSSSS